MYLGKHKQVCEHILECTVLYDLKDKDALTCFLKKILQDAS